MTNERPAASLRIQLTHPTRSDGARRVSMRILDDASMVLIADIDMDVEQFADFLAGRGDVHVSAHVPDSDGVAHLFRQRQNQTRRVPLELGDKTSYQRDPYVAEQIHSWATGIADAEGWDEYRVDLGSRDFLVRFLRWLPREQIGGA